MMIHTHLPHIDMNGHYQFISFRTADSRDQFVVNLSAQHLPDRKKQLQMDEYLDLSPQGSYLSADILRFLYQYIKEKDGELYKLTCFCVMPNHVHMLIKPLLQLSTVMKSVKGGSAKEINNLLGRRGTFWENDYYDTLIRDEHHFSVVYQYIKNNPLKLSGGGASAPQGLSQGLSQDSLHLPKKGSATEAPPPVGVAPPFKSCATEVAPPVGVVPPFKSCGAEVVPPRFYGTYDV
ncbi:MAG: transposase [Mariprofundus sp.]|nr:transposase [Mariprofundus sp.]